MLKKTMLAMAVVLVMSLMGACSSGAGKKPSAGSASEPPAKTEAVQNGDKVEGDVPLGEDPSETPTAEPEEVTFDDAAFEQVIRETLGKPEGAITSEDMAGITEMAYSAEGRSADEKVTSIKGIEYCVNLEKLTLSDGNISDITPLRGLQKLRWLDLRNNNISDLSPMSKLTTLALVDLGDNNISDLSPMKNLIAMTDLYLSNNEISDLTPLRGMTQLRILWFYNNNVSDISPVKDLPALESLDFDGNNVIDESVPSIPEAPAEVGQEGDGIKEWSPIDHAKNVYNRQ